MGWMFAIALFVMACKNGDSSMLITSGLFAIAGSIAFHRNSKGGGNDGPS